MTDETVDCFNCGRANPEWAQVCRSCGVPLGHGDTRAAPTGPFPTDQQSLISIGAVVGTILAAVLIGLFVSNLNPTDPAVGRATPSAEPSVSPTASAAPIVSASAGPTGTPPPPTPSPTPALPGTLQFGTELDGNRMVATPVDTFTPQQAFAYSLQMPAGFGATAIENEIVKFSGESETVVLPRQSVGVDPAATSFGYVIGTAGDFLGQWGPGEFEWRVYVDGAIVARAGFRFAEG
jgi:hypothetical protein